MVYKVKHNRLSDYTDLAFSRHLHHVEINAECLTREILKELINLVAKNGKASSAWAHFSNWKN